MNVYIWFNIYYPAFIKTAVAVAATEEEARAIITGIYLER